MASICCVDEAFTAQQVCDRFMQVSDDPKPFCMNRSQGCRDMRAAWCSDAKPLPPPPAPRQRHAPPSFLQSARVELASLAPPGEPLAQKRGSGIYPDAILTPGDTDANVTNVNVHETICKPGYSQKVRNVPVSVKMKVFAQYRANWSHHANYEVDHLVSLELGGSNDVKNLWPQRCAPGTGAHEKDWLENYLHREVCWGRMRLSDAQRAIALDWFSAWKKMLQRQN